MVNPKIDTSCIEQFWAIVKAKTVNGEVQLQARVDGKKIIVTEASIRSDLQLNVEEGMDCLPFHQDKISKLLNSSCSIALIQSVPVYLPNSLVPIWPLLARLTLSCLNVWNMLVFVLIDDDEEAEVVETFLEPYLLK
ncbi:hypothetical protein Tco_0010370 [Tanacetum coccineum]